MSDRKKKKSSDPVAQALVQMAGALGALTRRVAILEKEVATTKRMRQNLADRVRLERQLNVLKRDAESLLLDAAPPDKPWWARWLESLGLGMAAQLHYLVEQGQHLENVANKSGAGPQRNG